MKKPELSVVIPTKNEESNIAACIRAFDAVRARVEVIVVDNFSADRTREIASALGARVFTQGPERSAQRNRGWREATGDVILFVDADMILPRETIDEILSTYHPAPLTPPPSPLISHSSPLTSHLSTLPLHPRTPCGPRPASACAQLRTVVL